jgi:hypothetical protein
MTKKIDFAGDLIKTAGHLHDHFKKMAEHHLHKAGHHSTHAAFVKGLHEGMDDGHEHKAYFGKVAAHHENLSVLHKGAHEHHTSMAEAMKGMGDTMKAALDEMNKAAGTTAPAAVAPATVLAATPDKGAATVDPNKGAAAVTDDAVVNMIDKTMSAVFEKALETVAKSGRVEEMVEQVVLRRVNEKLGGITEPTGVRAIIPTLPGQLVPRPGQLSKQEEISMPAELAHFAVD